MLYTLMANCQAQGIDPERYLAEVIRGMPEDPSLDNQAAELTPAKLAEEIRRQQPMPRATVAAAAGRAAA